MFGFTEVMWGVGFVEVISTDQPELDWICESIKQLRPACKLDITTNSLSGEPFIVDIEELGNEDVSMAWWLIKQLCQRGWQPMSRTGIYEHGEGPTWSYFRLSKAI